MCEGLRVLRDHSEKVAWLAHGARKELDGPLCPGLTLAAPRSQPGGAEHLGSSRVSGVSLRAEPPGQGLQPRLGGKVSVCRPPCPCCDSGVRVSDTARECVCLGPGRGLAACVTLGPWA